MIRLYVEEAGHPWVTWDKDLYKHISKNPSEHADCVLVTAVEHADCIFINRETVNLRDPKYARFRVALVYFDEIHPHNELDCLADAKFCYDKGWTILTASHESYDKFRSSGVDVQFLAKPPRVFNKRAILASPPQLITCLDAAHPNSRISEAIRGYVGAAAILLDEDGFEPKFKIYSHSPLQHTPFNGIEFMGLQSNVAYGLDLSASKVFVWPVDSDKLAVPFIEALLDGSVLLVKKSNLSSLLELPEELVYTDSEDLSRKIVWAIRATDDELYSLDRDLLYRGPKSYVEISNTPEEYFYSLKYIIQDRMSNDSIQ